MKELSIEEKAKRYDEAIKRVENIKTGKCKTTFMFTEGLFEHIFPELAESEDERVMRELIDYFGGTLNGEDVELPSKDTMERWVAWLEKQGEQKSLDDMAKEVIKDKDAAISFLKSTGIMNENGELADEYKIEQSEQKPAEWNRNDEVLLDETLHFIREFQQSDRCIDEGDMQNSVTCENWLKSLKERVQPKQEWSEEDEKMLRGIIDDFSDELDEWTDKEEIEIITNKISFLKSLKPHPIHKWSREDNRTRLEITNYLECQKREEPTRTDILNKWIAWIANLDPQWKQNPAWSEEEIEKAAQEWDSKANFRPFYISPTGVKQDVTTHAESFKAGINWILKSLRPQNTWKPSDEQISLLQAIVNEPNNAASEFCQITLKEVIRQLKKLREEWL